VGFYIRKGLNFGPLRLNLSRSGLGASFGVKGARIGVGPRGRYVHVGRGGLYYRQTLTQASTRQGSQVPLVPTAIPSGNLQEITSAEASTMVDSSAAELLRELNRVKKRTDLFPIVMIVLGISIFGMPPLGVPPWISGTVFLGLVALAIYARHNDVSRGTVILRYSLEADAGQIFSKLEGAFQQLAGCEKVWHVDAAGRTGDWKRNAGVNMLVGRSDCRPIFSRPPKVECNINVPTLKAPAKLLYFFPDRLLVYDSTGVGAVSYLDIQTQVAQRRFVEDGRVPSDAQQVGATWRYVNRNGGPDRRFNNNRQLPVMLYEELALSSASGLNELFQFSRPKAAVYVISALEEMKRTAR
jgi:Protein of unknown function (DUF4236)